MEQEASVTQHCRIEKKGEEYPRRVVHNMTRGSGEEDSVDPEAWVELG
jgi:hypothetical protein